MEKLKLQSYGVTENVWGLQLILTPRFLHHQEYISVTGFWKTVPNHSVYVFNDISA